MALAENEDKSVEGNNHIAESDSTEDKIFHIPQNNYFQKDVQPFWLTNNHASQTNFSLL